MADIVVALDMGSSARALALVDALGDEATWYKVGPVMFVREGPTLVAELRRRRKRTFLDLKWHDIPNTVGGAVATAAALGAELATVHLLGGRAMLEAAVAAKAGGLRLVGVGVLTSMGTDDFSAAVNRHVQDVAVEQLMFAALAQECGLDGMVCAAGEAASLRKALGPAATLVVPGIRRAKDAVGDQSRIATPEDAARAGADLLVVGRPITEAHEPLKVYREFRDAAAV